MNVNQVKAGINTKDPYEIAKALTLPLLTAQNIHPNPNPKKRSYSERLTIDGTDWSPVLNSFLEARDHVFSVSANFLSCVVLLDIFFCTCTNFYYKIKYIGRCHFMLCGPVYVPLVSEPSTPLFTWKYPRPPCTYLLQINSSHSSSSRPHTSPHFETERSRSSSISCYAPSRVFFKNSERSKRIGPRCPALG